MIDADEARRLAAQKVSELGRKSGDEFVLLDDATVQINRGWVFFYNSAEYIRTRNPVHAPAGNGPLFVSRDGQVIEVPSSEPWEHYLGISA
jgi:hypothetical protein